MSTSPAPSVPHGTRADTGEEAEEDVGWGEGRDGGAVPAVGRDAAGPGACPHLSQ
ncbi:hypothetical protein GCM10023085_03260 [Actinomadura viridis]